LKLIHQTLCFITGLRLREFPRDVEAHSALSKVIRATILKIRRFPLAPTLR
jgi:hypothetical protein